MSTPDSTQEFDWGAEPVTEQPTAPQQPTAATSPPRRRARGLFRRGRSKRTGSVKQAGKATQKVAKEQTEQAKQAKPARRTKRAQASQATAAPQRAQPAGERSARPSTTGGGGTRPPARQRRFLRRGQDGPTASLPYGAAVPPPAATQPPAAHDAPAASERPARSSARSGAGAGSDRDGRNPTRRHTRSQQQRAAAPSGRAVHGPRARELRRHPIQPTGGELLGPVSPVRAMLDGRPFYLAVLDLRHVQPNAWQRALLAEGSIAVAVFLALAGVASPWVILALPLTVAVVVKAHDVVTGLLPQAPDPELVPAQRPRTRLGQRTGPPGTAGPQAKVAAQQARAASRQAARERKAAARQGARERKAGAKQAAARAMPQGHVASTEPAASASAGPAAEPSTTKTKLTKTKSTKTKSAKTKPAKTKVKPTKSKAKDRRPRRRFRLGRGKPTQPPKAPRPVQVGKAATPGKAPTPSKRSKPAKTFRLSLPRKRKRPAPPNV